MMKDCMFSVEEVSQDKSKIKIKGKWHTIYKNQSEPYDLFIFIEKDMGYTAASDYAWHGLHGDTYEIPTELVKKHGLQSDRKFSW